MIRSSIFSCGTQEGDPPAAVAVGAAPPCSFTGPGNTVFYSAPKFVAGVRIPACVRTGRLGGTLFSAAVAASQAVLIAIETAWDGRRQVLAVEFANRESRSFPAWLGPSLYPSLSLL